MGGIGRRLGAILLLSAIVAGAVYLGNRLTRVPTAELVQVVRRDGIPFQPGALPDEVLDRLAAQRVVILGENHFLREHRQLVAALLRDLHARGFRQYLFEWTQAADWLLADYVNDGGLVPGWTPPHDIGGTVLAAVRDLNRTLPAEERIRVHAIDVQLDDYGGTAGWVGTLDLLASFLPEAGPIGPFVQADHSSFDSHRAELAGLQAALDEQRADLVAAWGAPWYALVVEMVEVEQRAVAVRAGRESDYDESVRLREEAIQWLAERRIAAVPGGTLVNFGNTHAQKRGLWGTEDIEWLGDYLVHRSPVARGSALAVWVAPARITAVPGSGNPAFDLSASPDNELLRVMSASWPEQAVFLALDDPLFSEGRVPLNNGGDIYVGSPKRHYDAVLLLPRAQRDFVGD